MRHLRNFVDSKFYSFSFSQERHWSYFCMCMTTSPLCSFFKIFIHFFQDNWKKNNKTSFLRNQFGFQNDQKLSNFVVTSSRKAMSRSQFLLKFLSFFLTIKL